MYFIFSSFPGILFWKTLTHASVLDLLPKCFPASLSQHANPHKNGSHLFDKREGTSKETLDGSQKAKIKLNLKENMKRFI